MVRSARLLPTEVVAHPLQVARSQSLGRHPGYRVANIAGRAEPVARLPQVTAAAHDVFAFRSAARWSITDEQRQIVERILTLPRDASPCARPHDRVAFLPVTTDDAPSTEQATLTVVVYREALGIKLERWPTSHHFEIRDGHLVIFDSVLDGKTGEIAAYAPGGWSSVYFDAFRHKDDA